MFGFLSSVLPGADSGGQARSASQNRTPWQRLSVRGCDTGYQVFFCADEDTGEKYLGACFASKPAMIGGDEGTVDRFRSALGIAMPPGTFIQIGIFASPDVEAPLDRYAANKASCDNDLLAAMTTKRRDFILAGKDQPLVARSGVLLNSKTIIVTIKIPCSDIPDQGQVKEAHEAAERLSGGLKSAGLFLEPLGPHGYLKLLRRITHVYDPNEDWYDDMRPIREQVYGPGDVIVDETRRLGFHDRYFGKLMSVKWYPKRTSLGVMSHLIGDPAGLANQITEPFLLMLTLHYPDQVKKIGDVRRRHTMINHQAYGPMVSLIPLISYKKAGFDTLMHEIEGAGAVLVEINLTLAVFCRDSDRLDKLVAGLSAYQASLGFDMREDKRILRPLWDAILPLNTSRRAITNLFRFQTMAVSHAIQFLPIFGDWTGTGRGGASVFVSRRGEPVLFDLYDSATNYNAVIMAEAGSGKSFVMQMLIADYLALGAKCWAIDLGRSYLKLNRAVGGEFIEFSESSRICLNPFTHVIDIDEEMDLLKATLAKMAAPEGGLDDYRLAILEEAIKSVWNHYGSTMTVSEVSDWCNVQDDNRIRDIGRQLFPFTRLGSYGHWFDGANNLEFDRDFVVLELEELKSKRTLQQVVLLQLVAKINHEMYLTRGRKKILVVDEAWDLLDDPTMAKAMEGAYRRARKYDGAIVIVTQNIADLFTSPNARAIYQNSAWQLVLQQRSEAIDAAIESKQFNIEPYGVNVIKSVHTLPGKYSEIMIKRSENDWGVVRLVTDRFTQVLFSTKGTERNAILDAIERGENVTTAIEAFIAGQPVEN